jgi:DNA-binding response OmpR family regulator
MDRKRRVLIVDDSELALGAITVALEKSGYDVKGASSISLVPGILTGWAPDIVLADVNMPGVEGAEVCSWLKAQLRPSAAPVVLYSGLPEEDLGPIAEQFGADGYLTKAKGLRYLVSELRTLCREELS